MGVWNAVEFSLEPKLIHWPEGTRILSTWMLSQLPLGFLVDLVRRSLALPPFPGGR
nr:MAG: hypothetical protein H1Bulk30148_000003 [Mitovirus sp.]